MSALAEAKGERCRLDQVRPVVYYWLVPPALGGDDVPDNIVPLCNLDYSLVADRHKLALYRLGESLTDAEYAYVVGKLGEAGPERLFGVGRG